MFLSYIYIKILRSLNHKLRLSQSLTIPLYAVPEFFVLLRLLSQYPHYIAKKMVQKSHSDGQLDLDISMHIKSLDESFNNALSIKCNGTKWDICIRLSPNFHRETSNIRY